MRGFLSNVGAAASQLAQQAQTQAQNVASTVQQRAASTSAVPSPTVSGAHHRHGAPVRGVLGAGMA
jgi:hypothetical protein